MNPAAHRRHVARCLIAALLLTVLQPLFTFALAGPLSDAERMQVCSGGVMRWVRVAELLGSGADNVAATADTTGRSSSGDESPAAGASCVVCQGAALASAAGTAASTHLQWPHTAVLSVVCAPPGAPATARVIVDAPTRGPPATQRLA